MGKAEFLEYLRTQGKTAEIESGCVMMTGGSFEELAEMAEKVGYIGSMGWRIQREEKK